MKEENIPKILEAINKTGFITEFQVSNILAANGWFTINNRYYLDDHTGIPREIDIIAYKTTKIHHLLVYTALIISCKKSNEESWIFYTKKLNKTDPNIIFENLDNWTNEKLLTNFDSKSKLDEIINSQLNTESNLKTFFEINNNVFAMQEINNKTFALKNDQNIYNSIVSILKAKEFEQNSLSSRKKNQNVYNFFNLSIQDLEMLEFNPENSQDPIKEINHIKYLNRFILNKKDKFHLIHFVSFNFFVDFVLRLNQLHDFLVREYSKQLDEIERTFFLNYSLYSTYLGEITKSISNEIFIELKYYAELITDDNLHITYGIDKENCILLFFLGIENDKAVDYCNESKKLKKRIIANLEKYHFFPIHFEFRGIDHDIPF
ncbi:hypothetical protein [Leptospira levettii]|uniref:DUF4365 domain-containing protein n=1 Tax=Leptospira levettii TaxID=2023178 RepID=A0AAW5VG31_9LEPT|nr:hypothetical protein [Leptospira levettii]MCW7467816.1 hypothetical protein [Leptospira levettii]MCW7513448.1 hypothetical protein [Leptospira levettii]MCW7517210.1 hypothetical protein [Leptospira levettii]